MHEQEVAAVAAVDGAVAAVAAVDAAVDGAVAAIDGAVDAVDAAVAAADVAVTAVNAVVAMLGVDDTVFVDELVDADVAVELLVLAVVVVFFVVDEDDADVVVKLSTEKIDAAYLRRIHTVTTVYLHWQIGLAVKVYKSSNAKNIDPLLSFWI